MNDEEFKVLVIDRLTRIAEAIEASNRQNPLAEMEAVLLTEQRRREADPYADMPPAQRRAMGLDR